MKKRFSKEKNNLTAPIYEIFSSWQGEGLFAGRKQVFVRFSGCNLSCSYCDEKAARAKTAGITPEQAAGRIERLAGASGSRFVSFTGGEPLLYADFLKVLMGRLGRKRFRFFLETNGTLPGELKKIVRSLDVVSMDIKLPSFCGKKYWAEHEKFLELVREKVYVKIVVSPRTPGAEFAKGAEIVAGAGSGIPLFIQPESSVFIGPTGKDRGLKPYEKFYRIAASRLRDVRIVPQLHRLWGVK